MYLHTELKINFWVRIQKNIVVQNQSRVALILEFEESGRDEVVLPWVVEPC